MLLGVLIPLVQVVAHVAGGIDIRRTGAHVQIAGPGDTAARSTGAADNAVAGEGNGLYGGDLSVDPRRRAHVVTVLLGELLIGFHLSSRLRRRRGVRVHQITVVSGGTILRVRIKPHLLAPVVHCGQGAVVRDVTFVINGVPTAAPNGVGLLIRLCPGHRSSGGCVPIALDQRHLIRGQHLIVRPRTGLVIGSISRVDVLMGRVVRNALNSFRCVSVLVHEHRVAVRDVVSVFDDVGVCNSSHHGPCLISNAALLIVLYRRIKNRGAIHTRVRRPRVLNATIGICHATAPSGRCLAELLVRAGHIWLYAAIVRVNLVLPLLDILGSLLGCEIGVLKCLRVVKVIPKAVLVQCRGLCRCQRSLGCLRGLCVSRKVRHTIAAGGATARRSATAG